MGGPYGPIRVNANRQIALPKALTDELDLAPDTQVYVLRSELEPAGLVVVPAEKLAEWVRLGQRAERQQTPKPRATTRGATTGRTARDG